MVVSKLWCDSNYTEFTVINAMCDWAAGVYASAASCGIAILVLCFMQSAKALYKLMLKL